MARCGLCNARGAGQYGLGGTSVRRCPKCRTMERQADRGKGASGSPVRKESTVRSKPCPNGCGRIMPDGVHCPGPYC